MKDTLPEKTYMETHNPQDVDLKTTPCHDGIANSLPELKDHFETGNFVHSCHKTHPGADGAPRSPIFFKKLA